MVSAGSKRVRASEIAQAKQNDCDGIPKAETLVAEAADGNTPDKGFANELSTILKAMNQYKEKAASDVKVKNETVIQRALEQIKSLVDGEKLQNDKDMQAMSKAILKTCKDAEASMKHEASEFKAVYDKFCKERETYRQNYEDLVTKFEKQMEVHRSKLEHQKKKSKSACEKMEDRCTSIITETEAVVKKKKKQEKSLSILRKSINEIFESTSDDDEVDPLLDEAL